jgi:hypothetical protein
MNQARPDGPDPTIERACDAALLSCSRRLPRNTTDWGMSPTNPVYGQNQHDPTTDDYRMKMEWLFGHKWGQP